MKNITFRKGIKFFNEGRFHDAHEAWECHWLHMDESPEKRFLQGMIKVASALNKFEKKTIPEPVNSLKAAVNFSVIMGQPNYR